MKIYIEYAMLHYSDRDLSYFKNRFLKVRNFIGIKRKKPTKINIKMKFEDGESAEEFKVNKVVELKKKYYCVEVFYSVKQLKN